MKKAHWIFFFVLVGIGWHSCSHEHDPSCECITDEDCPAGHLCDEEKCICYRDESCTRDEDCSWGTCLECVDHLCTSFACESDDDCPYTGDGPRYCGEFDDMVGCRRCEYDGHCDISACTDPSSPLYLDCGDDTVACRNGECVCLTPCGGSCPDGTYCCRLTQLCEDIPVPCEGVECPPGEQVNPDPGGVLNEETCQIEGADCSCVPG